MLHCMHALEEAGKAFGTKKLQDLRELGMQGTANALCMQYLQLSVCNHCMHAQSKLYLDASAGFKLLKQFAQQHHICTSDFVVDCDNNPMSFLSLVGGDGTFLLDTGMSKVSVMELVHNGFLYPHETKAVSYCKT